MGRKKKGSALQEKIEQYMEEYKLDELNQSNDMAALTQMCQLELNMEQIQEAMSKVKSESIVEDSKRIRDLVGALRDASMAWGKLQEDLGIARKKRQTENEETPMTYIERLKSEAKNIVDRRLKILVCNKCGQTLGKYYFYVIEKGERNSIESTVKPIEESKYTVRCECWKCKEISETTNEKLHS
jgi:hypothetical protein